MNGPIILERDTPIIDWAAPLGGWCTTIDNPNNADFDVRSDGLLHAKYATMSVSSNTPIVTAGNITACGVHLTGPQVGDDFTPYQISAVCTCEDEEARPFLFVCTSPSTISSTAAGNQVEDVRWLDFGGTPSASHGSTLRYDGVILANVNIADRGFCVAIGVKAGLVDTQALAGYARLSVRRLIGVDPPVYDSRKL